MHDEHLIPWNSVKFSPTGDYLLMGGLYGKYLEIRTREGRLLAEVRSHEPAQEQTRWMHAGDRFVREFPNRLQLVDLQGQQVADLPIENNTGWIHFECRGESVLYLTQNGDLNEWTPQTDAVREIAKLTPTQDAIWDSFFVNADATQFLTHASSLLFQLWNHEGKVLATAAFGSNQCDWSPDGRYLICGDRNIYESQTLELVKSLPLDPSDPHLSNGFDPFWQRDDEIVLLSQSSLGFHRNSGTGAVRRFHPSGRQLSTPNWPQPLTPASATFRDDSRLSALYVTSATNSALINWDRPNAKPEVIKTEAGFNTPDSHVITWQPNDGSLIIQGGVHLDAKGKILRQLPSQAGNLQDPVWRPDGKHLAIQDYGDSKGTLLVYGPEGERVWTSTHPILK